MILLPTWKALGALLSDIHKDFFVVVQPFCRAAGRRSFKNSVKASSRTQVLFSFRGIGSFLGGRLGVWLGVWMGLG